MKTVIVYYSLEGNTDWAARELAARLGAELLRIEPETEYPSKGMKKFLWGGKSAVMGEMPKLKPYRFDAAAFDRVIIGFPVWASTFAPPIRTFVKENALAGKHVAAFACQSGNGAEKAFAKLAAMIGTEKLDATLILIDPKARPRPENAEKLDAFAAALS